MSANGRKAPVPVTIDDPYVHHLRLAGEGKAICKDHACGANGGCVRCEEIHPCLWYRRGVMAQKPIPNATMRWGDESCLCAQPTQMDAETLRLVIKVAAEQAPNTDAELRISAERCEYGRPHPVVSMRNGPDEAWEQIHA